MERSACAADEDIQIILYSVLTETFDIYHKVAQKVLIYLKKICISK